MVKTFERTPSRSRLAQHLVEAITRRELAPGDRIIEGKLAKELGVAKTTLREALHELEYRGLLMKYDHRGTFVTTLSVKEINDAYTVRIQLEPVAAGLACQKMGEEHFSKLRSLLDRTYKAGERRDLVEHSSTDAAFHQLIWAQSSNKILERALKFVCFPLWAFELVRLYEAPDYEFEMAHKEHIELLDVLRTGKPIRVERAFRRILQAFRDRDIRNLRAVEDLHGKPVQTANLNNVRP